MLLFEKELGFSNAEADTQFALWSGVCYVMPLFGGWIADRFLGELCTCWQAHQQAESKVHPRTYAAWWLRRTRKRCCRVVVGELWEACIILA